MAAKKTKKKKLCARGRGAVGGGIGGGGPLYKKNSVQGVGGAAVGGGGYRGWPRGGAPYKKMGVNFVYYFFFTLQGVGGAPYLLILLY